MSPQTLLDSHKKVEVDDNIDLGIIQYTFLLHYVNFYGIRYKLIAYRFFH